MATFAQGKIFVARTIGGQNDPDQLNAAGDAIKEAIQEWNLQRNWNFLLMDNSDDPIDLVAEQAFYSLPTPIKEPYTARLLSNNRTLVYTPIRDIDRVVRDQTSTGVPIFYTIYNGSTAFSATTLQSQEGFIRLFPTPASDATDELLIRYYRTISDPAEDTDLIDVPDRFLFALLARAKYYYMVNKDAEAARTQHLYSISEELWRKVVADDEGQEDRDVALVARVDYGQAWGSDLDSGLPWEW